MAEASKQASLEEEVKGPLQASLKDVAAAGTAVVSAALADTQAQFEHLNQATTIVRSKYEEVADHAVEVSALRREVAEDDVALGEQLKQVDVLEQAMTALERVAADVSAQAKHLQATALGLPLASMSES